MSRIMYNPEGNKNLTMKDDQSAVFVVMALETGKVKSSVKRTNGITCYCVCDSVATAQAIIKKDTEAGDIFQGASIEMHQLQTQEMV